ncbi:hypothetical protein N836_14330 [Leptolyngbya sp. Heron Island J]|uniref:hypothetical protein n=1 Tax=Leptolyngbya sp. Heron Island J TaxID=1385935 RepID=UPI0003B94179|nr:hypothetical protein [Leptolyngbya sp. Heron Island J]ESA34934.1 hypothetical protein N836_14330 [Leptolyngbya sp. Heron Island J]
MATRGLPSNPWDGVIMPQPLRFATHFAGAEDLGSGFPCPISGEPEPMFQNSNQSASALTNLSASLPESSYETGRHLLLGSLHFVQTTIKLLHKLNYTDPNDWSRPLPTGRPNEVMAILTKKVKII